MWHRTSLEEGIAGTTALTELCLEYLWNSVCLEQNEGENSVVAIPSPQAVHVLTPGTYKYVMLHGKGELRMLISCP